MVRTLIKLEGLLVFLACLFLYMRLEASWTLFTLLWLLPDIGMVGFLKDTRLGSITYNLTHTYLSAAALLAIGYVAGNALAVSLAIIWLSHLGLDRFLGYGLKYPTHFKDTHIQHL